MSKWHVAVLILTRNSRIGDGFWSLAGQGWKEGEGGGSCRCLDRDKKERPETDLVVGLLGLE